MEKIIYGSKMKKVDSYTMDTIGIPSMVLMERAAFSVFMDIKSNIDKDKSFLCICGMGNNGADGIALARMLHLAGYSAYIVTVGTEDKATEQWREQKRIAINCGVPVMKLEGDVVTEDKSGAYAIDEGYIQIDLGIFGERLAACDYVVDAIFGIGLKRNIQGIYAEVIDKINIIREQRGVYALDVPSGLCADTGRIMGIAVKATKTYTFGAMKTGLLLYKGKDIGGQKVICDIGFPDKAYENGLDKGELCYAIDKSDIQSMIHRKQHSNKGSYGKILVIAGSENVYGAAYFSAAAACNTGGGLVRIITHKNNRNLIYEKLPEAMINVYDGGEHEEDIRAIVEEAVIWADVLVVGPGLSKESLAVMLTKYAMCYAKAYDKHIVIDADALNIVSEHKELKAYYHSKTIITPHVGEAARLMGKDISQIAENIIKEASLYAHANNINVILKDSTTVILGIESSKDKCNNRVCINTSGNAGMATGGSGDVLSGIVAAVLAGGIDVGELKEYKMLCEKDIAKPERENEATFLGAAAAVYIHGLAGDMASERFGETSMTATDILNMISNVLTLV